MGDEPESNLEMRCSDGAWYDGILRVSPLSKNLIVVHFNDFGEEEDETFHRSELMDEAKLRSKVRVRSVQLQDSQCRTVYAGQKVCGCLDDGDDRKYYDAEVTSIARKNHSFKDDGEECLCTFTLHWLDGPRKMSYSDVGCAEICFLSTDAPKDDPMVRNLLKSEGDQPPRKFVKSVPKSIPKSVRSPRRRTPSPCPDLAPAKRQSSKEPSPPMALPNRLELARSRPLPIGSKKKRIMQAEEKWEEELIDRTSDNDKLENDKLENNKLENDKLENDKLERDGRKISAAKDSVHEEAIQRGNEGDGAEQRVMSGGISEDKNELVQAAESKRLVKEKAKVVNPEVTDREEAARDNSPRRPVKGQLKSNGAKLGRLVEAAVRNKAREDIVTQSLAERVKLKKTLKMTAPDAAPAPVVCDKPIEQDKTVQSFIGERVKLKIAQKSPAASPREAHKVTSQKSGKQVGKRKLIQLEDPSPDTLRSKFDKVAKPRTMSKPKEIAARPINVEADKPKVQKRKVGRPQKISQLAEPVTESTIAKKQQDVEISSEQKQSPQEVMIGVNADKCSSDAGNKKTNKRPRDEEGSQHDNDDIISGKSSQEKETPDAHVRKHTLGPAYTGNEKKLETTRDHGRVLPDEDAVAAKSVRAHDMAEEDDDHAALATHVNEANEMLCHKEKVSIAERIRDIENKYGNASSFSAPQAAQELLSLAGVDHSCKILTEEHFRVSSPQENSASHLGNQEASASRKGRRVGRRQLVIDDEDSSPDPSSSEFDKVMKPTITSKPKEIAVDKPKVQRRKAGRPQKLPQPESAELVIENDTGKKEQVVEISSEHKQSSREEEIIGANADKCSSDAAKKKTNKRPRDEERSHDNDDIVSGKSSQEETHVMKQSSDFASKKLSTGDHERVLSDEDVVSAKSVGTKDMAEDVDDHTPISTDVDETNEMVCHKEKISITERFHEIEKKYRNGSSFSTPQAAQELMSLAEIDPSRVNLTEECFRASSPHENSASHLGDQETGAGGMRQLPIIEDVMEDTIVPPKGKRRCHGSEDVVDMSSGQDECSPFVPLKQTATSDPRNTCSALDEEMVVQQQNTATDSRLLFLENIESDASAFDVLQLLVKHTADICAVHVMPPVEFQVSTTGYALYCNKTSALKALRWLTSLSHFVVSPKGRPWIVSLSKEVYSPRIYGFAAQTAYKIDDPGLCGIVSDLPHVYDFVVVTEDDSAYLQAQQLSQKFEEHKKWQKELYERIVEHEKKAKLDEK